LERARPDALAYLAWKPEYLALLEVSRRMGFPTIFGKTAMSQPDWTHSVCEDNSHAIELAVDALWEAGHRRIGLAINRWPEPWVIERHRAFEEAIRRRGGTPPELPTAWLDSAGDLTERGVARNNEAMADRLDEYLSLKRPTALLCGSQVVSDVLARLVRRKAVRLPADLSVVCIDQPPDLADWLGVEPTVVHLPLEDIGRGLFDVAMTLARADSNTSTTKQLARRVPCRLVTGSSIRAIDR
jgi:DNA-binding LacI/PurR family transcriptional regulator